MAASQERSAEDIVNPHITISGHENSLTCMTWLPDDRIVTGSFDRTVRIWNLTNLTQEGTSMIHKVFIRAVVTTKDGRIISCTAEDKHMSVWNADTQELVDELSPGGSYAPADCIVLSENEKLLASCHKGWIVFWEMARTTQVKSHINSQSITVARNETVTAACFSPDSKRLATCYNSGTVIVFDIESGEHIGPLEVDSRLGIGPIIWSPNGGRLLCGCWDGSIRFWNVSADETISELWAKTHQRDVACLSLSPDGKWLASGSSEGTVCFWDMKSGDLIGKPLLHGTIITTMAFSRSGEFIASGGAGGKISVWRVPWWSDIDEQGLNLLDLSAVVPAGCPSSMSPEPDLDFLSISAQCRDLPLQDRPTEKTSAYPPPSQHSVLSWRWWKKVPRFVDRPRPIYMGYAPSRTYAASRDSVKSNPRSLPQQTMTPPENNTGFIVAVESHSGESSDDGTSDTPTADPDDSQTGCCGLLPRRPRATTRRERQVVPVDSTDAHNPAPSASHPAPQDILELSAVVRSPDTP